MRADINGSPFGEESPGTTEQDARENEQAVRFENSATENKPPTVRSTE